MNMGKGFRRKLATYLTFAGPTTFIFFTVIIFSFLFGIYLTFTNWDGLSKVMTFAGTDNYAAVMADKIFWESLFLTIKYVFFVVIIVNALAFTLAYMLTSGIRGENFYRSSFFTPNLIGGIVLGLLWRFMFSNVLVHLGNTFNIPIFQTSWLGDPDKAFWALVVGAVWQYTGYMMLIYIAGFMNMPKDVLEAASIDGANGFVKLKNIILPLMTPSIVICTFLTLQRGFMVYDVNVSLTGGGPYKSTQLISMHVYEKAFLHQQYGVGQAEAFILFLVVAAVALLQVYYGKKLEVEA